jgi:hypothetical protein
MSGLCWSPNKSSSMIDDNMWRIGDLLLFVDANRYRQTFTYIHIWISQTHSQQPLQKCTSWFSDPKLKLKHYFQSELKLKFPELEQLLSRFAIFLSVCLISFRQWKKNCTWSSCKWFSEKHSSRVCKCMHGQSEAYTMCWV